MKTVSQLGEDEVVRQLTENLPLDPNRVVIGPGDDCAVLHTNNPAIFQLQKTDCVVEGIHFTPHTEPEHVGWKAIARAVSDIAAMGPAARPIAALITIAVAKDRPISEIKAWYRGMTRCAEKYQFSIVGGETTSLPQNSPALISVALTGEVPAKKCLLRSGAKIGDHIAVTGKLGGSFASGRHLDFQPRLGFAEKIDLKLTAMMDLSDGLAQDLPRLAQASQNLGYRIDFDNIPIHPDSNLNGALTDGEDYELLATFTKKPPPDSGFTIIGQITETIETPLDSGGWDHFRH